MKVYSITYDLSAPNRNYDGLHEAIKKCGMWWHYLESTWLVKTTSTPSEIFNKLSSEIDKNDSLLIIEVRNNKNGWLPQKAWDWINNNVPY